jgi:hypothetical protein
MMETSGTHTLLETLQTRQKGECLSHSVQKPYSCHIQITLLFFEALKDALDTYKSVLFYLYYMNCWILI